MDLTLDIFNPTQNFGYLQNGALAQTLLVSICMNARSIAFAWDRNITDLSSSEVGERPEAAKSQLRMLKEQTATKKMITGWKGW